MDSDIDPFNEKEVLWAVATRMQAEDGVDILRQLASTNLDPSIKEEAMSTKVIIDATKPRDKPFPERLKVPQEALENIIPLLKKNGLL